MKLKELRKRLNKYRDEVNVRAYEGEMCGIIIESEEGEFIECIEAHESDPYSTFVFKKGLHTRDS